MIGARRVLAVVPARGGSKGVPRKNLREVGGKPLLAWTMIEALASEYIDRVVVSSEDDEILQLAKSWGDDVALERPAELARDDTPGIEPVLHALSVVQGFDVVVLLQPTSPLRTREDIDGCIGWFDTHSARCCVSLCEVEHPPQWMFTLDEQRRLLAAVPGPAVTRRQDAPATYRLNGAVYVAEAAWLSSSKSFMHDETRGYVMPTERSIDVDTEMDVMVCEALLSRRAR